MVITFAAAIQEKRISVLKTKKSVFGVLMSFGYFTITLLQILLCWA
jgi:hypothetical protein